MIIGEDFEKIQFNAFGLDLLEPNAFITDTLLAVVAFYFAFKIKSFNNEGRFFKLWSVFYIIFGISFFGGGLGHSFFNYWGVPGKYFSWFTSLFAVFFAEQAMLSLMPDEKLFKLFKQLSKAKLGIVNVLLILMIFFVDLDKDPQKGILIPTLNTAVGFISSLGILGRYYQKTITGSFAYFWWCVFIMFPTMILQGMKISIHPWLDRNDLSHFLLLVALYFYYKGVKGYQLHHNKSKPISPVK